MYRFLLLIVFLPAAAGSGLHGQNAATASVSAAQTRGAQVGFRYENAQLQPAKYSFVIHEDGSGNYHSEPGTTPPADTPAYHPLPQAQEQPI